MKHWIELIAAFCLLPIIFWLAVSDVDTWLMPGLFAAGMLCLVLLLKDNRFKRKRLYQLTDARLHLIKALKLFVPIALISSASLYFLFPEAFLALPLNNPKFWIITLLIYPLVSVIPQELIFRAYFFHRYKAILPSKKGRIYTSSFLFGLAHIVYGNWIAVVLSWFAGVIFGYRYAQSRSTPIVVIEHTLWGSFAFTIGFGVFLLTEPNLI